MLRWAHLTAGIISVLVLTSLLIVFLRRWCCLRRPERSSNTLNTPSPIRSDSFQARISKLHQTSLIHQLDTSNIKHRANINNNNNYHTAATTISRPGLFTWMDHPALVTEAIENGWTRFGFTVHAPTGPTPRSTTLLGLCNNIGSTNNNYHGVMFSWEVSNGSSDFTQTIKFNKNSLTVLRAALPLPGPQLISSSFPQEAYFEIAVVQVLGRRQDNDVLTSNLEGEKAKLFKDEGLSLVDKRYCLVEETTETTLFSLGLATFLPTNSFETRLPGKFPASIGFQSDGAVYLDGMKLVCESEKHEWARENKVVGCGYDPRKKKVYFTLNSHLVHVINCKADEFGTPLYPILASRAEGTVHVNLGQSPFCYGPANAQRAPNPRIGSASASGFEDSKELFSIGRLDSQQLSNFFTNRENNGEIASGRTTVGNSNRPKLDYDDESDADLFEIALERACKQTHVRS